MKASKLVQFRAKAGEISKLIKKQGSEYWKNADLKKQGSDYYKQLLENNKHYIQEPATVEQCNLLAKQLRFTRLASLPGRYEAMWKEINQGKKLLKNTKELKVHHAGIATLFGLECFLWFKGGEIIGREGITDYHV